MKKMIFLADIFKNVLIDIDIFMNGLFDIDIDIFKSGLIDIDIFEKCRYINNRYISIDTSNTPKPQPPFQLRHQS